MPFDEKAAPIVAQICSKLGKSKSNQLWYDILIIATAIANRFGLATGNRKDIELIAKKSARRK